MSSLDISRRNLALRGREVFHQVADMAEYARQEINAIGGYYAFGRELMNGNSVFDFDTTKLSVQDVYKRQPIYHFDMFRVTSWDDLYSTGFFDYLETEGILVIEWSENIEGALPETAIRIGICLLYTSRCV